jgi:hypothetical protein
MSKNEEKQGLQPQPQYQEDSAWKPMLILLVPLVLVLIYGAMN